MMTDQLNYSVRSRGIEDSFILFYLTLISSTKYFPAGTLRRNDVDLTSSRRIDFNTTSLQRCVPAGLSSTKKKSVFSSPEPKAPGELIV